MFPERLDPHQGISQRRQGKSDGIALMDGIVLCRFHLSSLDDKVPTYFAQSRQS